MIEAWLIGSVIVGIIAVAWQRSGFGWLVLSLLVSPFLTFILLLLVGRGVPDDEVPSPSSHVKCPDCAELVRKEARVCKHCGCRLVPQP